MMEDDLIIKYVTDEATAAERPEVDAWLSESELHRERLASFRTVWELAGKISTATIPDNGKALEQLKNKLAAGTRRPYEVQVKRSLWIPSIKWRAAAVIICILAAATAGLLFNRNSGPVHSKNIGNIPEKVNPFPGIQEDFAGNTILTDSLPDGSVVTLNKNAKIRYTKGLEGNQRTVHLEGEAFFAVVHDASRPFVVMANDIMITDVGTSFNVKDGQDTTEISVATGIVLVKRGNDSVILRAGEQLIAFAHSKLLRKQIIQPALINRQRNNTAQPSPKKQKKAGEQLPSFEQSRDMMRKIINDLVAEKIIAGIDSLSWFGLDSSQFVVDGRPQPAALHEKFRQKYLKIAGYGYFYGPVKVYGQGVFFEKKDLYK